MLCSGVRLSCSISYEGIKFTGRVAHSSISADKSVRDRINVVLACTRSDERIFLTRRIVASGLVPDEGIESAAK